MAQNKILNSQPILLTATLTTNLFNVGGSVLTTAQTGFTFSGLYAIIRHARIINITGVAQTYTIYKGATGGNVAGTQVFGSGYSVAANSSFDWYGIMRLDTADFLVGGASLATSLTLTLEGEVGVAG